MMNKFLNLFARKTSDISVNGNVIRGRSVVINDNGVFVDGKQFQGLSPNIEVVVNGDCDKVSSASGDVTVEGNVGELSTASGDVACGDVTGDISTASGDVKGRVIKGNVKTLSGDIRTK